jgi:hypothetical protein
MRQWQTPEGSSYKHKAMILKNLEQAGSLQYNHGVLKQTQGRIDVQLKAVECETCLDNWILRALLQKLEM